MCAWFYRNESLSVFVHVYLVFGPFFRPPNSLHCSWRIDVTKTQFDFFLPFLSRQYLVSTVWGGKGRTDGKCPKLKTAEMEMGQQHHNFSVALALLYSSAAITWMFSSQMALRFEGCLRLYQSGTTLDRAFFHSHCSSVWRKSAENVAHRKRRTQSHSCQDRRAPEKTKPEKIKIKRFCQAEKRENE